VNYRVVSAAALALCAVLLQVGGGSPDAAKTELPRYEPDLDRAGDLVLEGSTWTREAEEYTVLLRELDSAERLRFIESRTGVSIDPFAAPPGRSPRYLTYLIFLENRGESAIGFNALSCWLKTNREEILTPVGLTDLSFDYQLAGLELPAAYERIAPALLEGAQTIEAGASMAGLLVYHAAHARTKRFHIEVDLLPKSGEVIRVRAPYRRLAEEPSSKQDDSKKQGKDGR
jgi:hypothetical protein